MSKFIIYIFFSVLLFSCYSVDKIPKNIIKPKEMKGILWDVMRAQTLAQQTSMKDSTITVVGETALLSKKIFQIHGTDSAKFVESYNWYVKHPETLKLIFDSLYTQKQRESDSILKKKEKMLHHPL